MQALGKGRPACAHCRPLHAPDIRRKQNLRHGVSGQGGQDVAKGPAGSAERSGAWQRLKKATSKAARGRKPTRRQTHGRGLQRGDLQTQEEAKECLQKGPRAPQPTGETPTTQRGHPVTLLPSQCWHEVRQVQAHMAQFSRHRAWQTRGPQ